MSKGSNSSTFRQLGTSAVIYDAQIDQKLKPMFDFYMLLDFCL